MDAPFNDIPAIPSSRTELSVGNNTDKDDESKTSHLSNDEGNPDQNDITLRYTQLLIDPVNKTVTAAEIEQTQRGDLWADASGVGADWCFYNGRSMTRRHRRTSEPAVGEITILDSLSTSSSSYDSSSYSSLSSGDANEEIHFDLPWEELVQGLALDLAAHKNDDDWAFHQFQPRDDGSAWLNEGDIMPFVMSELPLHVSCNGDWLDDDDNEPIGLALLDDCEDSDYRHDASSTAVKACMPHTSRMKDIRWIDLAQRLEKTVQQRLDRDVLFLLLRASGNPWCDNSPKEKMANVYESL